MIILGINQLPRARNHYHDSAAALIRDGQIVAFAEEERFNRERHTRRFPEKAIEYCLQEGDVTFDKVDYIAVSQNPYFIFKYLGFWQRLHPVRIWQDLSNIRIMQRFKDASNHPIICVDHHLAHAASAYFCSGFNTANVITIDSSGERESLAVFVASNGKISRIKEIPILRPFSNRKTSSVGRVYTAVSRLLGMGVGGEGKTMGLASYGKPVYDFRNILDIRSLSDWTIDVRGIERFESLARQPDEEPTQAHKDLAASLQQALENSVINLARDLARHTGVWKFCLAGGVALNCTLNGKLSEQSFCEDLFVQPIANDAGAALGAALETYFHKTGDNPNKRMRNPYWGPAYGQKEMEKVLRYSSLNYKYCPNIESVAAREIAEGKIVGWFQGRMEGGPRALGNRSILANPTLSGINDMINERVKNREKWRPFAPAVLEEDVLTYFTEPVHTPHMTLSSYVHWDKRSLLPGVTHVDGSARVQTISQEDNPRFYKLLKAFEKEVGIPVILNTSFNDKGEPIVCSPADAVSCFQATEIDILVLGDYLVHKPEIS